MQQATGLQFYYIIADPKVDNIFIQNFLYALVLKLQVILLIMEGNEKSESSHYSLSNWDRHPSYAPHYSYEKSS